MTAHLTFRAGRIIGEQLLDGSGRERGCGRRTRAFSEEVGTTLILRGPIGVVAPTRAKPSRSQRHHLRAWRRGSSRPIPSLRWQSASRPRTGQVSVNGGAMNLSAPVRRLQAVRQRPRTRPVQHRRVHRVQVHQPLKEADMKVHRPAKVLDPRYKWIARRTPPWVY